MPYTTLVAGTTITASWANASVRDQTVTPFATAAARTSAVTAPVEGMLSYRTDADVFEGYDGSGWRIAASLGAWTTYTPALTTSGSAPSVGNGTISGKYRYLDWKTLISEATLTVGTTTSFGTGVLYTSLPQTAVSAITGGGTWHAVDTGVQEYGGATKIESTTTYRMVQSAGGTVSGTVPFSFGSTDVLRSQVIYEPA